MATYKVLGQVAPAAATVVDLYTVPATKSAILSTINVCNRGGSLATFRIAVRPGGAALANQHYQYYDAPVLDNDTVAITTGWTLATGDVISVYGSSANLSITAFGQEVP